MTQYIVFTADIQIAQAARLRAALAQASNAGDDIYLLISSGGGNIFEGMSIAEFIRALPVKVTTHNIGQIDSIASVIFAAGTVGYANKNASFLFHDVTMHYEKKDFIESQLEEQYLNLRRMRENISATFAAYTGLSLTDTEALMISGATILSSEEALSKAIIHEVRDAAIPVGTQIIAIGNA